MEAELPAADSNVQEVMDQWPQTVPLFRHYAEACVGCTLAPFCTVKEAVAEYGLSLETFLHELQACINDGEGAGDGSAGASESAAS